MCVSTSSRALCAFLTLFFLVGLSVIQAQTVPTNGLRLHLKADAGVSVTGAENFVTGWANQSAVTLADASAPSEATRPTLVQNVINGQPVVRFSGGQYLNLPAASDIGIANSDYEMFIVYRSTSVFTNGMPGNVDIQFLLSGALEQYELHTNGGNGLRFIPNNEGATPAPRYIDIGSGGAYTNTQPHIIRLQATDTYGEISVNGADVQNNVKNARSAFEPGIRMGIRADGAFSLQGDIAEVIVYNQILSEADRNAVESYLNTKYFVTAPTLSATAVTLSEVTATSARVGFTPGNGSNRIVVARAGAAVDFTPVDGTTYAANADYTAGTDLGSGNKVVYSGTGSQVDVTGLTQGTFYHFAVFEYNEVSGSPVYRTDSPATGTVNPQPIPSANLVAFYGADFGTTLDAGKLGSWQDRSGLGNHASWSADSAFRPSVVENAFNGQAAIRFAQGGTNLFVLPNSSQLGIQNSDYEIFVVARSLQSHTNAEFILAAGSAFENYELLVNASANSGAMFIPRNGTSISTGALGQFTDTNPHIFRLRATDTAGRITMNDSFEAIEPANMRNSLAADILLGTRSGGTNYFYGDIAEVIIYNAALSEADAQAVEDYLAAKYTIPIGLQTPTVPASNILFSNETNVGMQLNLTPGNGTKRLIVAKAGSAVDFVPVNGTTYTANANYTAGTDLGSGNKVVYAGSGSEVVLTGLVAASTYHFAVFEFSGEAGSEGYLTANPARGSQQTQSATPSIVINPVANVTSTTATITGTVNPNGLNLNVVAMFGTDPAFMGYSGNYPVIQTDPVTEPVPVSFAEINLTPDTRYYVRINVSGSGISSFTETLSFRTVDGVYDENLQLWLSADFGVTQSGGSVSSWGTILNSSSTATQPTAGSQPTLVPNAINGLPGVGFTQDFMQLPSSGELGIANNDFEVFFVARFNPAYNGSHGLISSNNGYRMTTDLGVNGISWLPKSAIVLNAGARGDYTGGQARILHGIATDTFSEIRVDGVTLVSQSGNARNTQDIPLYLGWLLDSGSTYMNGEFAEVLIYNRSLSESKRQEIQTYLSQRYAIPVQALPPTVQASNLTFSNIASTSADVQFTAGNGARRLVVIRENQPVDFVPTTMTTYSAGQTVNGNIIAYKGDASAATLTNLRPGSTYHVAVIEFNGDDGREGYLGGTVLTGSETTLTMPTVSTSNVSFTDISFTAMTVNFTPGNGQQRLVIARSGSAVTAVPAQGTTYTANPVFGSGTEIAAGEFVVYAGDGNTVTVTGLTNSTTYHFAVFEYGGVASQETYFTTNPGVGSSSTQLLQFAGGGGTEANPFQIATAEQLNTMRDFLSSWFVLTADIDLNVAPFNTGEGWVPVGSNDARFTGNFDGAGFTISNLFMNRTSQDTGLFGVTENATVQRLTLASVNVASTQARTGALAGQYQHGLVNEVSVSGSVNGESRVGGLIGELLNGTVSASNSSATITGSGPVIGGLIAETQGTTTIQNVHSSGSVSGTQAVGGLIGQSTANITSSYATGSVTGSSDRVGGLAGFHTTGSISLSYATGPVQGNRGVGGLIGYAFSGAINDSYATGTTRGIQEVGGLVGHMLSSATIQRSSSVSPVRATGSISSSGGLVGYNNGGRIENSWAGGLVLGNERSGGLVGQSSFNSTVINSYSFSFVSGSTDTGGLFGIDQQTANTTASFWSTETSGQAASIAGTGKTEAELRQQATFTGWDFDTVWNISEGSSFPYHRTYTIPQLPGTNLDAITFGNGSSADPYLLIRPSHLSAVRDNLNANYQLAINLDMTSYLSEGGAGYNAGAGWEPIGSTATPFTGTFSGGGKTISGLRLNRTTDNLGLFGVSSGNISNLVLDEVSITGSSTTTHVGALVGQSTGGAITNIGVGGGTVTGGSSVGALAGSITDTDISLAYAGAVVTGSAGGTHTGGLLGNITDNLATVNQVYSYGTVTGGTAVGGLIGANGSGASVTDAYWNQERSGQMASAGGTSITSLQARQAATYAGWDFATNWTILEGVSFPGLRNALQQPLPGFELQFAGGTGSQANPFQITTAAQLDRMRDFLTGHFVLTGSIDLNQAPYNTGTGWVPIGTQAAPFTGSLNGGGFTISNLFIARDERRQGLFGQLGGEVRNLTMTGVIITVGDGYAEGIGSVAGRLDGGSIRDVSVSGMITAGNGGVWSFGGLTGFANNATIQDAMVAVNISAGTGGPGYLGGVIGEINRNVTVARITTSGNVTASGSGARSYGIGGFAGSAYGGSEISISHVSVSGTVTGGYYIGGFIGDTYGGTTIRHSSATGNVVSQVDGNAVGGFIGYADTNDLIEDSYATGSVTIQTAGQNVGGFIGDADGLVIRRSYATGSVTSTSVGDINAGGFAGRVNKGTITDSYALGAVSGVSGVGGFAGVVEASGTLERAYANGAVAGSTNIGGFAGTNAGTITNAFWDTESSGQASSAGGDGLTTAQMKQRASFTGWDFDTVWSNLESLSFPWIQAITPENRPGFVNPFAGGFGTAEAPFQITTPDHLNQIRNYLSSNFVLNNDIDLNVAPYNTGNGWVPAGGFSNPFSGSLNGNNFAIRNLFISRNQTGIGLFRNLSGSVSNLTLSDVNIEIGDNSNSDGTGTLAAFLAPGSHISNLHVNGSLTSGTSEIYFLGGIAGYAHNATIENSSVNVHITLNTSRGESIGGIIGLVQSDLTLRSVRAGGSITTNANSNNIGGLVGSTASGTSITNAFAVMQLTGNDRVAGVVGQNAANSTITNTYAFGRITANQNGGGLVGSNAGTVTNSYWNPEVSTQPTSAGGTAATLTQLSQSATFDGWDFTTIWDITEGASMPWLRSAPGNHRVVTPTLTGTEGWRVLATPLANQTVGSVFAPLWTQGFTGADVSHGTPNVYTWSTADGTKNQANWTAVTGADQALAPGQGALIYVFRDDQGPGQTPGTFPKVLPLAGSLPASDVSLTGRLNPNVNGWALVGNPFGAALNWNAVNRNGLSNAVYVYDPALGDWRTWNGSIGNLSNGEIGAFNAFFVETLEATPSLDIPLAARNANAGTTLGKTEEPLAFSLTLNAEGSQSGTTWFHFTGDGDEGLDPSDAKKLNSLQPDRLYVASESEDETLLAINHLPVDLDELVIPLHYESPVNGTHELQLHMHALPADWTVQLTDHRLNRQVVFSHDRPVYSFEHLVLSKSAPVSDSTGTAVPGLVAGVASEATSTPRFSITIRNGAVTGIAGSDLPSEVTLAQNYPNPFNPTTTIAYALPETATVRLDVFDMLGRRVAALVNTEAHAPGNHTVSFDAGRLTTGVYVYRLQAGNTVITRKMTLIK